MVDGIRTKPVEKTLRIRRSHAGAMVGVGEAVRAVRERGGLVHGPRAEGLFHWRLREPILIWRDPDTKQFVKSPAYAAMLGFPSKK
ncbi:MAG: hypothetical protein QG636_292 [Patescibacteria group bacterium]|nr:hypothetical protein [Patescibacteria group bacterium]